MTKRAAIITPTALLESVQQEYQPTMHLALAHIYQRNEEYANFYRRRVDEGDTVILDQGAAELGSSIPIEQLVKAAFDMRASIVVAPDTLFDADKTIEDTTNFLNAFSNLLEDENMAIMAVPQGNTIEEWMECYKWLNDEPRIGWLGISMFCTPAFGARIEALKAISSTVRKPCHLLGLWKNPFALLEERSFPFVFSIDTAKPVEFALEGLTLAQWDMHMHIDDDWYFDEAGRDVVPEETTRLMDSNIRHYRNIFERGIL